MEVDGGVSGGDEDCGFFGVKDNIGLDSVGHEDVINKDEGD